MVAVFQDHGVQAYLVSYEPSELIRRDLTQAFKPGDLRFTTQLFYGGLLFGFRIAVNRFLFVAHPEQRRL